MRRSPRRGPVPFRSSPLLLLATLACASARPGETASYEQLQASTIFAGGASLLGVLTSGPGNLVLFGGDGDSLAVRYALSSQTRAGLFRNQVETIDKGDSLFVSIRPTQGSRVDLQLEMPEDLAVDLRDDGGRDTVFRNIENRVTVIHGGGSLDFEDIEGPLSIRDGGGPIRIRDVRGPLVVEDEGGGIRITEVQNSVRIQAAAGDVTLEKVGGDVRVQMGAGRLTVRDVTGRLTYGKSGSGEVVVERIEGGVERL